MQIECQYEPVRLCGDNLISFSLWCQKRWWVGPWQHCSITCGKGRGLRRRTVICVRSLSDDEQMALHDADCPTADRPIEEDVCEPLAPCPGEASWETGTWSKVVIINETNLLGARDALFFFALSIFSFWRYCSVMRTRVTFRKEKSSAAS